MIENRPFKTATAGMLMLSALISASECFGQNTLPTERIEDVDFFETRIRPLLIAHCLGAIRMHRQRRAVDWPWIPAKAGSGGAIAGK